MYVAPASLNLSKKIALEEKVCKVIHVYVTQKFNNLRGLLHAAPGGHTKVAPKINEGLRTVAVARQL